MQARELQQKYEKKMKMLRDDLELRRKQVRLRDGMGQRPTLQPLTLQSLSSWAGE